MIHDLFMESKYKMHGYANNNINSSIKKTGIILFVAMIIEKQRDYNKKIDLFIDLFY